MTSRPAKRLMPTSVDSRTVEASTAPCAGRAYLLMQRNSCSIIGCMKDSIPSLDRVSVEEVGG